MISQVVFDLPLDGPFDYLIPEPLIPKISVGMRVKVSFGPRPQLGYVIGLLEQSAIAKLKPILSQADTSPIFDQTDLGFAREFAGYYGCSLGEALSAMLRNKQGLKPSIRRETKPRHELIRCDPDQYILKIKQVLSTYGPQARFLILAPDLFRVEYLSKELKGIASIKIGMRSAVFESDGQYSAVIMLDEEDASFKQEQTPMYETRQVLLERSMIYGFDIVFISVSPSVELMAMARDGKVSLIEATDSTGSLAKIVDLTNYKFVPGLISPPVRDAIDAALKSAKKSILVLNRRGSYRLTRCVDCAEILKCAHCDSPLIYSRSEAKFLCRHCTYTAPGDTVCPKCHKTSWKSVGIGVEQLQTELKKQFPLARIASFERAIETLGEFDILISTNAVLRFQGMMQVAVAAFIDFDAELNRLDMRSAFNAMSLALHVRSMASGPLYIQTRNLNHYVLKYLSRGDLKGYYEEELSLRKEFGFSPFKHWVKICWRGKLEALTREAAQEAYQALVKSAPEQCAITPPLADAVIRKREQFRINVMVQADNVPHAVSYIKTTLSKLKRRSKVIMTFNIDP